MLSAISKVAATKSTFISPLFFFFITDIQPLQFNQCLLPDNGPFRRLLFSSFISRHPSISDHSQYSLNYLNFGLPASGFPINTFLTILSSDIRTRWAANYSIVTFTVVTVFCLLYITCNSSLDQILQPFWSFIRPHIFLNIFHSQVLRDDFICSVIAHASQPYSTIDLIIVVHIFSFVSSYIYLDLSALYHCFFSSSLCS